MISTIPVQFDVAAYASTVKPNGFFTQVGMPEGFALTLNNLGLAASRVNFNASLIGGIPETQDVVNYCADSTGRLSLENYGNFFSFNALFLYIMGNIYSFWSSIHM